MSDSPKAMNTDSCSHNITFTVDGVPHAYTVDDWYVEGCDDGLIERNGTDAGHASTGMRGGATRHILLLKDTEAYVELDGDNGTFHRISENKRSTTPIQDVQIDM
jgi:hypothetical protein